MGRDKALVFVEGQPLIARVAATLAAIPSVSEIVVACGGLERERAYRKALATGRRLPALSFVADEFPGMGPAHGLAVGLEACAHDWVAVAPTDAPTLAAGVYDFLFAKAVGRLGAVPTYDGRLEPLVGVYRREAAAVFRRGLDRGERSVSAIVASVDVALVEERALRLVDPRSAHPADLDTRSDIERSWTSSVGDN
jgi:molybdopterin-guanine dinucleotide biosynthesis protein A